MQKKRIFSMSAAALILVSILSACTQDSGTTKPQVTTGPPSTMGQEQQSKADEIQVKEFELENKEVTFLASWARNPANGKNKDVALELFQTRFGGKVKDVVVGDSERYEQLSKMVTSDNSPDFFSASDMDAFPKGAIKQIFNPLDDYIDFNDQWFGSRKALNDAFVFGGKHYVSVISPEVDVLFVYNKAVVAENGLKDPADLLKEGNWNWDTCKKMMNDFCDKSEDHYATDGWWITQGICNSTGVPFIGMENGKVVNNIKSPLIEEAQQFLLSLNTGKMAYPVWDYGWVSNPGNVGLGKTLFYPVGFWALTEVETDYGLKKYGEIQDVGFVPVPKCPSADEYYIPARITGYMLCSGAPNPEGFACLMYCEAAANDSEEAEQITKEQYFNEYGWTEEMWEMRNTIFKMLREHPVFDFQKGISDALFDALDNPVKDSYHNGASWVQTRESIYGGVQSEVDAANSALGS